MLIVGALLTLDAGLGAVDNPFVLDGCCGQLALAAIGFADD